MWEKMRVKGSRSTAAVMHKVFAHLLWPEINNKRVSGEQRDWAAQIGRRGEGADGAGHSHHRR